MTDEQRFRLRVWAMAERIEAFQRMAREFAEGDR